MTTNRTVASLALVITLAIVSAGPALSEVTLEPAIKGRGSQWLAFANQEFLAYTQWSRARPNRSTALAVPIEGGDPQQLNRRGTRGFTGGFDPGTNRVIYQEWTTRRSTLFFYDLDRDRRTKVPGVNVNGSEWSPLVSTNFVMFERDRFRGGTWHTSVHVHHREQGVTRKLGTWRWDPTIVFTGSVGDRYAAYTVCPAANCFAYLYDWETKSQRRIPTVRKRPQYAPVIDEANGVVYVSRSRNMRCGSHVGIWRLPLTLDERATKVVSLPAGIDTGWKSSLAENGATGMMDLYIEYWNCALRSGDVYVARGVNDASVP